MLGGRSRGRGPKVLKVSRTKRLDHPLSALCVGIVVLGLVVYCAYLVWVVSS